MPRPNTPCGCFFRILQQDFLHAPEMYVIRDMAGGRLWRNRAARTFWEDAVAVVPWSRACRWVHHEDLARLEDCESRAIKLHTIEVCRFRLRTEPLRYTWMETVCKAIWCPECPRACVMLISQPVPADGL